MSNVNPPFIILIGTNGTGKTTKIKELLKIFPRNLILPANSYDPGWRDFRFDYRLEVKKGWKKVQRSSDPKDVKDKPMFYVPGINQFTGLAKLKPEHSEIDFAEVLKTVTADETGFAYGGLVIDDFKNYIISSGLLPSSIKNFFIGRRHREVGIYMACHGWTDINRELLNWNPELWIHKTKAPPHDTFMSKIDPIRHAELHEVIRRVNSHPNDWYMERFVL